MDDDVPVTTPAERPRLPPADMPELKPLDDAAEPAAERSSIFRSLVNNDSDITGLVAYSIYKQNKLDWLTAFEAAKSRAPTDEELQSYIIGEGTQRRLTTYRQLAEATLADKGPGAGYRSARAGFADRGPPAAGAMLVYAVVLVALFLAFWVALRYTMAPR